MGYVVCTCGERISDVAQPNSNEGLWFSTFEWDQLAPEEVLEAIGRSIFECPNCRNLIVGIGGGEVVHYKPVDAPPVVNLFADRKRKRRPGL